MYVFLQLQQSVSPMVFDLVCFNKLKPPKFFCTFVARMGFFGIVYFFHVSLQIMSKSKRGCTCRTLEGTFSRVFLFSDICNIYIYVTFCDTKTRDFRTLSTNNIVKVNWKVGESFQNTKVVCLFYISVHCIHIPIDLAWYKTVRKPLQLYYYNCQSNHDSLIGVLSQL